MTKPLTPTQAMRYSRHIMLPGFDLDKQERLLASSVLLIGVGGLGCAAAQYLVASGVGSITLVDDDVVEHSNIQRQILHGEADLGTLKCASAKDSLNQLNSDVNIQVIEQRLNEKTLTEQLDIHDIAIDCTDNLASRNLLNKLCWQTRTPLVSGAAIRLEGQLFCVIPARETACYACLSDFFGEQNLSCTEAGVLSPLVGVVGSYQGIEAIKILTEFGEPLVNKLMLVDVMTTQTQVFDVRKKHQCQVCGHCDEDSGI